MTVALRSIAIFVSDIDRAIRFYRDDLRLPLVRQGSFGAEFLDDYPHLGVHPAAHPNAQKMVGRETGLTFYVENLLTECDRLHAAGVRFVQQPTRQSFGVMAMIADPDGNVIALWDDKIPDDE
jgi:predicted enzyme related to lactoylglutathione lyase